METDAELAALAGAGDVQAVAGLLERHRPALYAVAIGLPATGPTPSTRCRMQRGRARAAG